MLVVRKLKSWHSCLQNNLLEELFYFQCVLKINSVVYDKTKSCMIAECDQGYDHEIIIIAVLHAI